MRLYDTLEMLMVMYLLINDVYLQNLIFHIFLKISGLKALNRKIPL